MDYIRPWKVRNSSVSQEIPLIFWIRSFITVVTRARWLFLPSQLHNGLRYTPLQLLSSIFILQAFQVVPLLQVALPTPWIQIHSIKRIKTQIRTELYFWKDIIYSATHSCMRLNSDSKTLFQEPITESFSRMRGLIFLPSSLPPNPVHFSNSTVRVQEVNCTCLPVLCFWVNVTEIR
jgi:hypothetical protein